MDDDNRFSGMRVYSHLNPGFPMFSIRGNKLRNTTGGVPVFEIRGSRIYSCGNPSNAIYEIAHTEVRECGSSLAIFDIR